MLLFANVDDVSGELIPHAIDGLMARGACSVHVVQAITKKGRLEYLFWIDCGQEHVEALAGYLALELGTLGVRVFDPGHVKFAYQFCQVRLTLRDDTDVWALVRVKRMIDSKGQTMSIKAELEDLRAALIKLGEVESRLSLKALKRLVEHVVQEQADSSYQRIQVEYLGGVQDEKDLTSTG